MLLHNKSFLTKIMLIRRRGPTSKFNMSGRTPLCGGTPMLGTYPKTATTNLFLKRSLLLLVFCCVVSISSYFLLRAAYVSGYLSHTSLLDVFPSFSLNFVMNRAVSLDRHEVPPLTVSKYGDNCLEIQLVFGGIPMLGTPKTGPIYVFLRRPLLLPILCCVVFMSVLFSYVSGYLPRVV